MKKYRNKIFFIAIVAGIFTMVVAIFVLLFFNLGNMFDVMAGIFTAIICCVILLKHRIAIEKNSKKNESKDDKII